MLASADEEASPIFQNFAGDHPVRRVDVRPVAAFTTAIREHDDLLAALMRRDANGARTAMIRHLKTVQFNLLGR